MTRLTIWDPNIGDRAANLALTNNFAATADPTAANDSTQGYTPGSQWLNVTTQKAFVMMSNAVGAAVWQSDSQAAGETQQGNPTAKTVSSTLTAAQILAGIITINQGAGAASAQQLPLASAMDTAFPTFAANDAFDFSVINTSVVDAEDASLTTNTGWTLVGSMDLQAHNALASGSSSGRFRARKTGTGAWTLYRLA